MLTNKKILLIGGTGFVGRHLARVLGDAGAHVTIPTRRYEKNRDITTLPCVTLIEADVNDPGELDQLVSGRDAVINLIGILHSDPGLPYGKQFAETHVQLPQKIVAACQKAGVRRLLHMSALHASKDAPSEYLRSKAAGEDVVTQSGLLTTIFRPSVIFGARDSFINVFANLLRALPILPLGCANARFQPVSVDDVAHAFTRALHTPATEGQTYDLCGPKIYSLREIVEYTASVLDIKPRIIPLSDTLAYFQAAVLSLLPNKLMSADNVRSMELDSVCGPHCNAPAGWNPQPMESVVPLYLLGSGDSAQFDEYRSRAGR